MQIRMKSIATMVAAGVLGLSSPLAFSANIAPDSFVAGTLNSIPGGYGGSLIGLIDENTAAVAGYTNSVASLIDKTFGMDLTGSATGGATVSLLQDTSGGARALINQVRVYTNSGSSVHTLNYAISTPTIGTFNLTGPTSWMMVEPLNSYPGGDTNVGLFEVEVDAATFISRINVAAGITPTLNGGGWNNGSASDLTDGTIETLGGIGTAIFNGSITSASVDIDFGDIKAVSTFGIGQNGAGRQMLENVTITFSNASDFSSTVASHNFTLVDDLLYQQRDFAEVAARYVRFSVSSQHATGDANIGITELQFYEVIPEPASLALLAAGGLLMLSRRRNA